MTSYASHYLDQFAPVGSGTVTMVNGTTTYNIGWMSDNDKIQDLSYELPSGAIFDPHGTQVAPKIPGEVSQVILVKGANAAATKTIIDTLRGLEGKRGILQAIHPGGSFVTCTARCMGIKDQEIIKDHFIYAETKVIITFRKLTNWA